MNPEIHFLYSNSYDLMLKEIAKSRNLNIDKMMSKIEIFDFVNDAPKYWNQNSEKVFNKLFEITNLKYKDQRINCYLTNYDVNNYNPMTIKMQDNRFNFSNQITHELIHILLDQNRKEIVPYKVYIDEKYKNESSETINHILVNSIHKKIIKELFYGKEIESNDKSVEIIQNIGYENIIKEFLDKTTFHLKDQLIKVKENYTESVLVQNIN